MNSKKPIKCQCKHCKYILEVPFRTIKTEGSSEKCPQCHHMIDVPAFWDLK